MTAWYTVGDTRDLTAKLPDDSVDLVLTSPPFLALRSYLPDGHPDKGREIGSEATPAAFLDVLLGLTAEWGRVLAPHGSIAIELGDTYSGTNNETGWHKSGNEPVGRYRSTGAVASSTPYKGDGWPLAKSLAMIPELYRIGLAYGINPLTGQESPAGKWRVRNVVRWVRPNPPVGALGDKYRPATSEMVIATRARDRWFDLDAVRTAHTEPDREFNQGDYKETLQSHRVGKVVHQNPNGAPPLDWWSIPTHGYKGAHYATWPPALCEIPIKSMCPLEVCTGCGEPRRRITEQTGEYATHRAEARGHEINETKAEQGLSRKTGRDVAATTSRMNAEYKTLGWTECDCAAGYRQGIVFDPFAGSGTTLAVATGHGREAIGFDLDERNLELARERVGMFLTEGLPV